ncbi:MAG: hypothetical protein CL681_21150 [Blastopirellula sp.]|nr:hypothetical protein [Blastopirellula sp.]
MTARRFFLLSLLSAALTADAAQPNYQVTIDGRTLQGTPLQQSTSQLLLLARDGSYQQVQLNEAENLRRLPGTFRSYSQSEIRGRLLREFGRNFDVSGTGNYLVVHPRGKRDQWAPRFEKLYRSFQVYFGARGVQLKPLRFPLIAIVFPTRSDFLRYAQRQGVSTSRSTRGYYSHQSNRIILYDVTAGRPSAPWHENASTIIHETVHQVAFNTGLHSRSAAPPRWVSEGLAMMFEAPGVWDARKHPRLTDRINRQRMEVFEEYRSTRPKGQLASLVTSDRVFHQNVLQAYSEAWALTFFLAETRPRQYTEYLLRTSQRKPFRAYSQQERLRDFTACFGDNLTLLEAHYLRFIDGL